MAHISIKNLTVEFAIFGKGGGHPAQLNFGDCFTYALAEWTGHPVLCTGDDFAATDLTVVRPRPALGSG